MKSIQKGDLVKFYRRKTPGLGLVMKHMPDVIKSLNESHQLEILCNGYQDAKTWKERRRVREEFVEKSGIEEELANAFLLYNKFDGSLAGHKIKKEFVFISWVKRPSNYETTEIRDRFGWYPAKWLQKV